ncbi:hypothetical protein ACS0PU_012849 [Formica fusca]
MCAKSVSSTPGTNLPDSTCMKACIRYKRGTDSRSLSVSLVRRYCRFTEGRTAKVSWIATRCLKRLCLVSRIVAPICEREKFIGIFLRYIYEDLKYELTKIRGFYVVLVTL